MTGFIKCAAVGFTLTDAFLKLSALDSDSPSLIVAIIMLAILFFSVYFSFSGYSDMGVGIARIFGVRLNLDSHPPFASPTPAAYFTGFSRSLRGFIDEYFIFPLRRAVGGRHLYFAESVIFTLTVYLIIGARPIAIPVAIPTVIFMFLTEKFSLKSRLAKKKGIQSLLAALNAAISSCSLVILFANDGKLLAGYLRQITVFSSEYKFDRILIAISTIKLLFIFAVAFFTCVPKQRVENFLRKKLSLNPGGSLDYAVLLILLALFAFTVLFFLPQYPEYDFRPFRFIYL